LLDRPATPAEYERINANLRHHVRRATDGVVDPDKACKDWTRCYRLPAVVRDGKRQPYPLEPLEDSEVLSVRDLVGASTERDKFADLEVAKTRSKVSEEIAAGARNSSLASAAGILRNAGFAQDEILAALLVANDNRCDPPLDEDEVARIAESYAKYDAPAHLGGLPPRSRAADSGDDTEFELGSEAEITDYVLAGRENGGERLRYDRGKIWIYAGPATGVWTELRPSSITNDVSELDGAPIDNGKGRRYLRVGASLCHHVTDLVRAYRDTPRWFDEAPPGIALADGVVQISEGGELVHRPHSPEHRLLHVLPFGWDPDAQCPRLESVLGRAFQGTPDADDRAELLMGFIGTCLVGRATTYQKALILIGEGANGKSTVMDVGAALFPPGARTSIPPQRLGDDYHRAEIAGALINIVAEVPETDIVAAEAFRAFVDGSELTARRIREAPFSFRPTAGHLWAANNLPGARDFSPAFWRRWVALEFPNMIPEEEQEEGLSERIILEELPGVLRWVLEAAARVMERGSYQIPSTCRETLAAWKVAADQVALFSEERLEATTETAKYARGGQIYDAYRSWAQRNGHKSLSSRRFGERLKRLGFEHGTRTAGGKVWQVALIPSFGEPIH
ncbi:MAG: primase C-terminal domain-containing protein, partial [Gammaproteobacteria bacterium]|nr:primase C-terminal domain-containing protein [Gammaproteobacteria bacterium]